MASSHLNGFRRLAGPNTRACFDRYLRNQRQSSVITLGFKADVNPVTAAGTCTLLAIYRTSIFVPGGFYHEQPILNVCRQFRRNRQAYPAFGLLAIGMRRNLVRVCRANTTAVHGQRRPATRSRLAIYIPAIIANIGALGEIYGRFRSPSVQDGISVRITCIGQSHFCSPNFRINITFVNSLECHVLTDSNRSI